MNWLLGPLREGIITILIVAGPIIIVAAAAGLLIGILQAATQIQDQAIPNAVKLIGILVLLVVLGVWMFSRLTSFTEKTIARAFSTVISNRTPVTDNLQDNGDKTIPSRFGPLQPPFKQFGQLSGNTGSFQAQIAPPTQAFSNAMQNNRPPVTYYPFTPQQQYPAAPFNQPTYNSPQQSYSNYSPQPQFNQQYPPANAYSYNSPNSYSASPQQGQNNSPQSNNAANAGYMNNPYQPGYYPPNQVPQHYPPQYNQNNSTAMAYSQGATNSELVLPKKTTKVTVAPVQSNQPAKNKVILQSTNPQPMKILRPKLPGMESTDSNSNEQPISGDALPQPASNSNWW